MTDSLVRTYVLDTSVLLSDPWACTRFAEHEVVVPLVVISELEGQAASSRARLVRPAGAAHVRRSAAGTRPAGSAHSRRRRRAARCTSSSTTAIPTVLPAGFRTDSNDSRILTCRRQPRRRGQASHVGQQGHSAAGQGRCGRAGRRRVPRPGRRHLRLDRDGRDRGRPPRRSTRCSPTARSTSRRPGTCPATPEFGCSAAPRTRWAG